MVNSMRNRTDQKNQLVEKGGGKKLVEKGGGK